MKFNETEFKYSQTDTSTINVQDEIFKTDTDVISEEKTQEDTLRCTERHRRPPVQFGQDEFADLATTEDHLALAKSQIIEPQNMEEAISTEHSDKWIEAADAEYKSLMENDTWELVELPKGGTPIRCKWVFKVKYGRDGKIERFKARLVAKGFSQKYGIDYHIAGIFRLSLILFSFVVE